MNRRHIRAWLPGAAAAVALWSAALVAGCGARDPGTEAHAFVQAISQTSAETTRRRALAVPTERIATVAPGVDAEALLDWAQYKYPALFPQGTVTVDTVYEGVAYTVRAYPGGNFLGVTRQGEVWGLGGFTGGKPQNFGLMAGFAAQVQADRCSVYAERCAPASALDNELRALIAREGLTGDPTVGRSLPHIADALPQLGRLLFFSKSLSANRDTACASCHHPVLGGGDGLGVSVGAGAANPDLVGPGRMRADKQLFVARNANTFFNSALYDRVLFADGRVESLAASAAPGGQGTLLRTPDGAPDPLAGPNLLAAQARFPITGAAEMRGDALPGMSDHQVREHIATRLASEAAAQPAGTGWLPHFRRAFGSANGSAAELITFDNMMRAIAEYERSAVFVKSPWQRYVLGENLAIGDEAKNGALVFYRSVAERGMGCSQCHNGNFFSDEQFHPVGFPQTGPGFAGDGVDAGRQRVSAAPGEKQSFRTPSLLNVEMTAPYGHAGSYGGLATAISHYVLEIEEVRNLVQRRSWCRLAPFREQDNCVAAQTQSVVARESYASIDAMQERRRTDPAKGMPVIDRNANGPIAGEWMGAFLNALTDPCLKDRACLARWIPRPDEAPDAHQLNAVDSQGQPR